MSFIGSGIDMIKPVWAVIGPIWVVAGPVAGFLAKSELEKRKKKKISRTESISEIKRARDLMSSKQYSIGRDIELFKWTGKNIHGITKVPPLMIPDQKELHNLSIVRIVANCQEVIASNFDITDDNFVDFKENLRKYKHTCTNLKNIIQQKSFDSLKLSILEKADEDLRDAYSNLMASSQRIYKD